MAREQRVQLGRDPGLQFRMLFTIFLLGLLYVALVGVLFAAGASAVVILVVAGGLAIGQLFLSDKIGLAAMGAKEVTPEQAPGLHAMVERLCIQADLPKPKVAVADTPMPNAFAMGRTPKSATVCVTTGLMNTLEPPELEAVMAHELTHVKNRDVMIMTIASFFAMVASVIVQFGFFFGGGASYSDAGDDDNPSFLVVILVSFVVYILSFFLILALSRYREFSADKGAALITGRPSALSSALMKISGQMDKVPEQDLRAAQQLSAFFIMPPRAKAAIQSVFMDHPPTEKRIERLQRYEAELQGTLRAAA
jgi:heat shock protein HtpX